MAISTRITNTNPSTTIEYGSWPGVINAAKTASSIIIKRRLVRSCSYVIKPAIFNMAKISGTSKLTPKISRNASKKLKYCSPLRAVVWLSAPMVSKKESPSAITKYASTAPHTNNTTAIDTNENVQRRSFFINPGVIKPHNWASHTGEANTAPANEPTLRRSINISNGPVASSLHSPSAVKLARASGGRLQ